MAKNIRLSDHFTYGKLLCFTLPSMVMMVFTSIYGVVDGLFVSNFVGKTAFASVNLVMPFVMILGGMGFMIGTGGTALVSKILGEGDPDNANRTFSMMVLFTLALGAVLSGIGIAFMGPVARFLGATDAMMADCVLYGRIVTGFTFAFMLQNVFQSFFIAAEKPKLGLKVTVAAGVTNMVLDALFIAVFKWGVAGAALATGLSQCVGGVLPLAYFLQPNTSLLRLSPTRLRIRPILAACGNGSSELMSNISSSLVSMLYNFQLMRLAGEDGVSAYGVLMYVQFIFISLFVGYDAELFALTSHAFRLFAWSFLLAGFNIFTSGFFTALNNGAVSAAISFLRTLVFQSASVLILPVFFGVDGIWWAITVAEVFAFLISGMFLLLKRNKYHYM